LKLPVGGVRIYVKGEVFNAGINGSYWTSTVSSTYAEEARNFSVVSTGTSTYDSYRALGMSVRCIKD